MEAKELRIGNIVYSKMFERDRIVGIIGRNNLLSYECENGGLDGTIGIIDANPIPLTEEWLLKFGFEKISELEYNIKLGVLISICIDISDYSYAIYDNTGNFNKGAYPTSLVSSKYVHQLQNLYFALTGKELEYENRKV